METLHLEASRWRAKKLKSWNPDPRRFERFDWQVWRISNFFSEHSVEELKIVGLFRVKRPEIVAHEHQRLKPNICGDSPMASQHTGNISNITE